MQGLDASDKIFQKRDKITHTFTLKRDTGSLLNHGAGAADPQGSAEAAALAGAAPEDFVRALDAQRAFLERCRERLVGQFHALFRAAGDAVLGNRDDDADVRESSPRRLPGLLHSSLK